MTFARQFIVRYKQFLEAAYQAGKSVRCRYLHLQDQRRDPGVSKPMPVTTLVLGAISGDLARVNKLLDSGSDPNSADEGGMRPLFGASAEGHAEVARILLERGALVNARTPLGFTPLHYAAVSKQTDTSDAIIILVEHGADIEARTDKGLTPLVIAAITGKVEAITTLLSLGANPCPGAAKETAVEAAIRQGRRSEIIGILREAEQRRQEEPYFSSRAKLRRST